MFVMEGMDEILERLLRQHPEAVPIRRSKYIHDCHVGRGRVWRAGQPVVTGSLVFPNVFPSPTFKKVAIEILFRFRFMNINEPRTIKSTSVQV
jgi:hypothetical protein